MTESEHPPRAHPITITQMLHMSDAELLDALPDLPDAGGQPVQGWTAPDSTSPPI
jgi:hypothetical protein